MLVTWGRLSSSSAALATVVVVMVVIADAVNLTGVVIPLERVGGGGVVGSFATILPGRILLKEQHVHTGKDRRCKSPPGNLVDEDEEDGGWWVSMQE